MLKKWKDELDNSSEECASVIFRALDKISGDPVPRNLKGSSFQKEKHISFLQEAVGEFQTTIKAGNTLLESAKEIRSGNDVNRDNPTKQVAMGQGMRFPGEKVASEEKTRRVESPLQSNLNFETIVSLESHQCEISGKVELNQAGLEAQQNQKAINSQGNNQKKHSSLNDSSKKRNKTKIDCLLQEIFNGAATPSFGASSLEIQRLLLAKSDKKHCLLELRKFLQQDKHTSIVLSDDLFEAVSSIFSILAPYVLEKSNLKYEKVFTVISGITRFARKNGGNLDYLAERFKDFRLFSEKMKIWKKLYKFLTMGPGKEKTRTQKILQLSFGSKSIRTIELSDKIQGLEELLKLLNALHLNPNLIVSIMNYVGLKYALI